MATATKTLGINAAFLHEIKQENRDLKALLHRSQLILDPAAAVDLRPREVAGLLAQLRDQIALHFALEEAYGYFEDALEAAPRLSSQAEAFRAEHKDLFLELCAIAERAEAAAYERYHSSSRSVRRLAARFSAFLERLRKHEAQENDLILQAFEEDLGGGD